MTRNSTQCVAVQVDGEAARDPGASAAVSGFNSFFDRVRNAFVTSEPSLRDLDAVECLVNSGGRDVRAWLTGLEGDADAGADGDAGGLACAQLPGVSLKKIGDAM